MAHVMERLKQAWSNWRDSAYRCVSCGRLMEQRGSVCSQECRDQWRDDTAY